MIPTSLSFFSRLGNASPWRAAMSAALCLVAAACASSAPPPPPQVVVVEPPPDITPTEPQVEPVIRPERLPQFDTGVRPPHMADRQIVRAALLLPFSSTNEAARREAASMLNAAELALFERGGDSLLLIPKDTGGTQAGARAAAESAQSDGAHVILGPLFAQAVNGAGGVARRNGTPVVAFSTDRTVAGQGVYLLSFTPEEAVRRAVQHAQTQGAESIALLGADTEFTRRVEQVMRQIEAEGGPRLYRAATYPPNDFAAATMVIESLAAARGTAAPGAPGVGGPPDPADGGFQETPSYLADASFQALFLADSGTPLRELSTVLRANSLTASDLPVYGPTSWRADPSVATVFALRGALVAGPDETERSGFERAYRDAYGDAPTQLASLAYDAVALASQLHGDDGDWDVLENRNGYLGADGLFRLPPDGVADRGLAIYQLGPAGFFEVGPAPIRFDLGF